MRIFYKTLTIVMLKILHGTIRFYFNKQISYIFTLFENFVRNLCFVINTYNDSFSQTTVNMNNIVQYSIATKRFFYM